MTDQPKPDLQDGDGIRKPLERLLAAFKGMMPFPLVVQAVAEGLVRDVETALATPQPSATVEVPHEDCLNCHCAPDERCAGYRLATPTPDAAEGARAWDWVNCPICDEPDMRCETFDEGATLIHCTNHGCPSNKRSIPAAVRTQVTPRSPASAAMGHCAGIDTAPPKPAPDAIREALAVIARDSEGLLQAVRAGDTKAQLMIHIGGLMVDVDKAFALSTPVPSPDGLGTAILNSIEETAKYLRRADPATIDMDGVTEILLAGIKQLRPFLSPSGTGAAEPESIALSQAAIARQKTSTPNIEALAVDLIAAGESEFAPPVRGDREIPRASENELKDGWRLNVAWLQILQREVETATGYQVTLECVEEIVLRIETLLPVQSTARPDKEAAAQIIAKRMFGSSLEDLESLTRDNCRDTVTEIFELAGVRSGAGEREAEIVWLRSSLVSLMTLAEANPSPLTNKQVASICKTTLSGQPQGSR